MMYKWLLVLVMVIALPTQAQGFVLEKQAVVDRVEVKKSVRRMYLMDGDVVVREYRIALGKSPRGHKIQEGDNRTPEGKYYLDFVMDDSAFYRSMHISYPNLRDKNRAESLGVSPGGNIKIHGLKNGDRRAAQFIQSFDWTNGCIAITNEEMDELVSLVKIGTPIYIRW
ncbi:L,D-transpeptidase family protein [Vibrio maritimus]